MAPVRTETRKFAAPVLPMTSGGAKIWIAICPGVVVKAALSSATGTRGMVWVLRRGPIRMSTWTGFLAVVRTSWSVMFRLAK